MTPMPVTTRIKAGLGGAWGLVLLWLGLCALLLAVMAPALPRYGALDPDDYMRLAQVRDWLGGQGWFDVRQYRMDPPAGTDMHWSRLIDLPIAAFLAGFSLFLPAEAAIAAAMTAVPLLQLLVVMALVRRILLTWGESSRTALLGAALLPLFPILIGQFVPLRIDHHGWQGIAALASALMLARGDNTRSPWIAGLIGALWLSISLEGLPLVGLVAGIFALRDGMRQERAVARYLAALAAGSLLVFVATHRLAMLEQARCDAVSWPQMAAFAVAALLTALLPLAPGQARAAGRFAGLAICGGAAGAVLIGGLGRCAVDPFGGIDPVVRRYWLENVSEGLPVMAQTPAVATMLAWTALLIVAGWMVAVRLPSRVTAQAAGTDQRGSPSRWHEPALLALGAALLALVVMRAALAAQMLAVPLVAVLIGRLLPRIRAVPSLLPRLGGTLVFLVCATPLAGVMLGTWAESLSGPAMPRQDVRSRVAESGGRCPIAALRTLPRTRIFALLDMGPEILARTPHSVAAGPYHRNDVAIRRTLDAFGADPARAEAVVRSTGADYVAVCPRLAEAMTLADRWPGGLAAQLVAGKPPRWLRAVPLREKGILLYAVVC